MTQTTIADIEKSIKEAKKLVDFGASVERLRSNRDFKNVILDGYFKEEAVRLVHRKAMPEMQNPNSQAMILAAMDSIGNLHQYLEDAIRTGENAAKQITDGEQAIDELNAEENADE